MKHPRTLILSLAFNLLLMAALMVTQLTSKAPAPRLPAAAAKTPVPAPKQAARQSKLLVKEARPAAFHWAQLDAPDFSTFVKNLRAIGCPEATIRDIISGELREIQQREQQQLAQSPQRRAAGGAGSTPRLMQAEFERLQQEQERQLAAVLGPAATASPEAMAATHSPVAANNASTATGPAAANSKIAEVAQTPAAFLVKNSTLEPTPTQAAAIDQMKNDFSNAVQASGQNPSSPEYRLRWNQAQIDSNEQFSSLFGGDRFIQTQQEAVQAAASAPKTQP